MMHKLGLIICGSVALIAQAACSSHSNAKVADAAVEEDAADIDGMIDAMIDAGPTTGVLGTSCTPMVTAGVPKYADGFCEVPLVCIPTAAGATTGACGYAVCPTGAGKPLTTLEEVSTNLFQTYCIGCHGPVMPRAKLDLSSTDRATLTAALTDSKMSTAVTVDEKRVKPGDADNSLLIHKLMTTGTVANQYGVGMPRTLPGSVCPETITALRAWINAGSGTTLP